MGADLLDLSRRATRALQALRLTVPAGALFTYQSPSIGDCPLRMEKPSVISIREEAFLDLRDPLTRAGALPLLVREAWGRDLCVSARYTSPGVAGEWVIAGLEIAEYAAIHSGRYFSTGTEAWVVALEAVAAERRGVSRG